MESTSGTAKGDSVFPRGVLSDSLDVADYIRFCLEKFTRLISAVFGPLLSRVPMKSPF